MNNLGKTLIIGVVSITGVLLGLGLSLWRDGGEEGPDGIDWVTATKEAEKYLETSDPEEIECPEPGDGFASGAREDSGVTWAKLLRGPPGVPVLDPKTNTVKLWCFKKDDDGKHRISLMAAKPKT